MNIKNSNLCFYLFLTFQAKRCRKKIRCHKINLQRRSTFGVHCTMKISARSGERFRSYGHLKTADYVLLTGITPFNFSTVKRCTHTLICSVKFPVFIVITVVFLSLCECKTFYQVVFYPYDPKFLVKTWLLVIF